MTKIIKIEKCEDCFFVRNLESQDPTYCIKALMDLSTYFKRDVESFKGNNIVAKIFDVKSIPAWCPLEEYPSFKRFLKKIFKED